MIQEIEKAIEQFLANDAYEARPGKLADTIGHLKAIAEHSGALVRLIRRLTPVGKAAIHDVSMVRVGEITGRDELRSLAATLQALAGTSAGAADLLHRMHSPLPDEGQGSGSAIGRDSELRAIRAEHDESPDFEFRSPKDKLGVAVIKAYLRHDRKFDVTSRGAATFIQALLNRVWGEIRTGETTNWKRVTYARMKIAELLEGELRIESFWNRALANENVSSSEQEG